MRNAVYAVVNMHVYSYRYVCIWRTVYIIWIPVMFIKINNDSVSSIKI